MRYHTSGDKGGVRGRNKKTHLGLKPVPSVRLSLTTIDLLQTKNQWVKKNIMLDLSQRVGSMQDFDKQDSKDADGV